MVTHYCLEGVMPRITAQIRPQALAAKLAPLALASALLFVGQVSVAAEAGADSVEQSLNTNATTRQHGSRSQYKIDQLAAQTRELLAEYQRLLQLGDYQQTYNAELTIKQQQQQDDIATLKQQLVDIRITQQRLLPLLREMVDTLEQFIQLDIPFQHKARLQGVADLKTLLMQSQVSLAEKFRRVMAFYQAENDMNYDLESYRDVISIDGQTLSVELLRIGRTALYYQTMDQLQSGLWLSESQQWQPLAGEHHLGLRQAIRIANDEAAPGLLALPLMSLDNNGETL